MTEPNQRYVAAWYRDQSTRWLQDLRRAFELDRGADDAGPENVAFCNGRIAIIDRILQEREALKNQR